jgi:hypothetical protein
MVKLNAVFLAAPHERVRMEFFGVVDVNHPWQASGRPVEVLQLPVS